MISLALRCGIGIALMCFSAAHAQDIEVDLRMPGSLFGPGSPCYLDLEIGNPSNAVSGASVFVALTVGTGDFWFYPGWVHYPPDVAMMTRDIDGHSQESLSILPVFIWPSGTGEFSGAQFLAAIVHGGDLVSNLDEITFGWSETPQPTPSPDMTVSPTATPSNPTPTPSPEMTGSPTATPSSHDPGDLFAIEPIAGNIRYIPATDSTGFSQGSTDDEACRDLDETMFMHVLTRPLGVMETEITRQMWMELRAADSSLPTDPTFSEQSPMMTCPVQNLDWYEAVLFANLLSLHNGFERCYYKDPGFSTPVRSTNYTTGNFFMKVTANGYRLPTEGEWEHFARAGTTGVFSCDEPDFSAANCTSCEPGTHPVLEAYCLYCANDTNTTASAGSKWANDWNLRDIHGNVWEWCWDWYAEAYPTGTQTDYSGAETGSWRSRRGGSWNYGAHYCRSANRGASTPTYRFNYLGFRLVRTLE